MSTLDTLAPNSNLGQHARDLKDNAKNIADDVKTEAGARYSQVKDQATSHLADARDHASDLYDNARTYATENPLATFGIGIAVGLVLSAWLRK